MRVQMQIIYLYKACSQKRISWLNEIGIFPDVQTLSPNKIANLKIRLLPTEKPITMFL